MSRLYSRLRSGAALLLVGTALAAPAESARAATILVTTNADDNTANGNCTLREAVLSANSDFGLDACTAGSGSDVILLTAVTGQTITLTLGEISTGGSQDIVIGDATTPVTINGGGASRLFVTRDPLDLVGGGGANVVFQGITFTGGSAPRGGAVLVQDNSTVVFASCNFTNNVATGSATADGGGAVFSSGDVQVAGGSFTNNTATAGTANGGAIMIDASGTLIVSGGTTFTSNRAARAGGAIETAGTTTVDGGSFFANTTGINGGGVHMTGPVTATFTGATLFRRNAAGMEGGAIWNSVSGTLNMTGSQIVGNVAAGPAADQGGGGVFSDGGITNLTDLMINGNRATGAAGSGGGVQNTAGGRLTIIGGEIRNNRSVRAGGGVEANQSGGATGNTTQLTNVVVIGNNAGTAPGFGGGVHVSGAAVITVAGGQVRNNTAVEGGGLWKSAAGTLTISGTIIRDNTATGALATNGGGGVFSDGGTGLTISDARIQGNAATGAAGSGGGLFNDVGATTTVTNTMFFGNTARRAGGGIEDNAGTLLTLNNVFLDSNNAGTAPGNGGGLHITGAGTVVMNAGTARSNTAVEGGGLWKSAAGTLTLTEVLIDDNTATGASADQGGGGLYNDGAGGMLTVTGGRLLSNQATGAAGSGGGLLNNVGGTSRLTDVDVVENTAVRAGGGIEDNAGMLVAVMRMTLRGNTTGSAPGNGGGIHITGAGTVEVDSSEVLQNTAANQGGGLWNSGLGRMTVRYTTVASNSAPVGGGLYQVAGLKGITFVENSIVRSNTASTAGGGIAADGATVVVENSTISTNTAGSGGGLASGGGRFLISSATIVFNRATVAGGGLFRTAAMGDSLLSPDNTIIANNTAPAGADISGIVMSRGYNLIRSTAGGTVMRDEPAGPDLVNVNPLIQPIANNGGPTRTYAVAAGSPAVGAGMTSLVVDQRGYSRTKPSTIGAFEFGGTAPVPAAADAALARGASVASEVPFALGSAVPNPFRGQATLRMTAPEGESVEVALYDALGRRVQTLYAGTPTGAVDVTVDGSRLAPGVYVVRMTGATAAATQRVTVAR